MANPTGEWGAGEWGYLEWGAPGVILTAPPPPPPPTVTTGLYRFVITDLLGNELDEIPILNPKWAFVLNDSGTADIEVPLRATKATHSLLAVGQRQLRIYRGSSVVWGGDLWTADASMQDDTVRLSFEGYFGRLKRRYVDTTLRYDNTDQLDVAWNLINYTQNQTNGDLGITRGSGASSGINRDALYGQYERPNIGDELMTLSQLTNGFDFDVSPAKVWTTYYPSKGNVKSIPFDLHKNIRGFGITEDAAYMATEYSAIGAGDGKNTCIAVALDSSAETTYGLLEVSESFSNIKRFATLQDRASSRLKMFKKPRVQPSLSIQFVDIDAFNYVVGDKVNVNVQYGWISLNKQMRIISLSYELSNEGVLTVVANFDEETTP